MSAGQGQNCCVCFCLLCGLPGSGKSSLSRLIAGQKDKDTETQRVYCHVEYDQLISSVEEEEGVNAWKQRRVDLKLCLEEFLMHLLYDKHASSEPVASLDSLCQSYKKLMPSDLYDLCRQGYDLVLVIDDNMYLHSMRQEFFKMAQKFNAGYCVIFMDCEVSEALKRNRMRSSNKQVPDEVIMKMASKLEPPNREKFPWEKHILVQPSKSQFDLKPVTELIDSALSEPEQQISGLDEHKKFVSRLDCSVNTLHQVDLVLRKCVAEFIASNKDLLLHKNELKELGQKASRAKNKILQEFKNNNQDILVSIKDYDIQDASKDSQNDLYQFVYKLFHTEVT